MTRRQFTCEACKRAFVTETTKEAMEAEFVGMYGHSEAESDDEIASVCDDCYAQIQKLKALHAAAGKP